MPPMGQSKERSPFATILFGNAQQVAKPEKETTQDHSRHLDLVETQLPVPGHVADLDKLESGTAREYIAEKLLRPVNFASGWKRCRLVKDKDDDRMFQFFLETQLNGESVLEFLAVASKQPSGYFEISQYMGGSGPATSGACAVLLPSHQNSRSHKLYSLGCERCDSGMSKFTCGAHSSCSHARSLNGRQVLLDISHKTIFNSDAGCEIRDVKCKVPKLTKNKLTKSYTRDVWCPRGGTTCQDSKTSTINLETAIPEWNDDMQSLVQTFEGNRIKRSSSKNIMLLEKAQLEATTNKTRQVLQFGKSSSGCFALDFKYPLCPIQALAIALSHWMWLGSK